MSLFLINTTYSVFICFQAKVVLYSIGKKLSECSHVVVIVILCTIGEKQS